MPVQTIGQNPGTEIGGVEQALPYANARKRLEHAIQAERAGLAQNGTTTNPRLEHLQWILREIDQGNPRPLACELAGKCLEAVRNLRKDNVESQKNQMLERLKMIEELMREHSNSTA